MSSRRFKRVILIVLDGVGVGAQPDAGQFGDSAANTLLHVAEAEAGLSLPMLQQLGLGNICPVPGLPPVDRPLAAWGRMTELSPGKDTTTGHWELAGLETVDPFVSFPEGFPDEIIAQFEDHTGLTVLGNIAASGTDIIRDLGVEHIRTGAPIIYTSIDSVFQIAAHEEIIPPEKLYDICLTARRFLDPYRIGRVIARPFVGTAPENFKRTPRRHDFSMPPPAPTLLDQISFTGLPVVGIGKISDIFAGQGVTESVSIIDNEDGMRQIVEALDRHAQGLVFANLVDFDMLYGHRRDTAGFASALVQFDIWLADLMQTADENDLVLLTADHGCDPVIPGTDHSREFVPVIAWHKRLVVGQELGTRKSFCDMAATVAAALGQRWPVGESFLDKL